MNAYGYPADAIYRASDLRHQRQKLLIDLAEHFTLLNIAGMTPGIRGVLLFQRQLWQQCG